MILGVDMGRVRLVVAFRPYGEQCQHRCCASPFVATSWHRRRLFYTGLPIAMALAIFIGFAPTHYLKAAFGTPALAPLYHVHGFLLGRPGPRCFAAVAAHDWRDRHVAGVRPVARQLAT